MKRTATVLAFAFLLVSAGASHARVYDAVEEYACEAAVSDAWAYEGFRASDGTYLLMVNDRAPLTEITKYGVDAHFIPDGDQPYYPFITRFPDGLWASPATKGGRFDAVLTWKSHEKQKARLTGHVTLKGNLEGQSEGRKIKAMLVRGGDVLWKSDISGGQTASFDVSSDASSGDRFHLHIMNAGDTSGNMALFDMKVDASAE